jgi:hypothetical protein
VKYSLKVLRDKRGNILEPVPAGDARAVAEVGGQVQVQLS